MEIRRLRQALFPSRDIVSANILIVVVELYEAQIHGQISLEQTYYHQVNLRPHYHDFHRHGTCDCPFPTLALDLQKMQRPPYIDESDLQYYYP